MFSYAVPIPGDSDDDAPLYDDSKDACQDIDINSTDDEEIVKVR